jgi:hypothetical protein
MASSQTKREFLEQIIEKHIDAAGKITEISTQEIKTILKWLETQWVVTSWKPLDQVHQEISSFITTAGLDAVNMIIVEQIFIDFLKYDLVDESITEASLEMKALMTDRHINMDDDNKLPDHLFQKLLELPLTCEVINGVTVVNRPGFGKLGSSSSRFTSITDMDKVVSWQEVKKIEQLQDSEEWQKSDQRLKNRGTAELKSIDRSYILMNKIAIDTFGLNQEITKAYIYETYIKHRDFKNLPPNHPLGITFRALSIIIDSWVLPVSVVGHTVRSVGWIASSRVSIIERSRRLHETTFRGS